MVRYSECSGGSSMERNAPLKGEHLVFIPLDPIDGVGFHVSVPSPLRRSVGTWASIAL